MLYERDMSAGEIAACFSISKPSISHHLNVLKAANAVSMERHGQEIRYSLNLSVLQEAILGFWQLFEKNEVQNEDR